MSTQDERSATPLDRIRLTGVTATGHHGVLAHERRDGQPFVADVVAYLDTRRAAARDDLAHTLDYGALAEQVVAVLEGDPADLIETVAERIAATVLAHAVVQGVDVTVHKPQAPITVPFGDVAVEIHRDRTKLPAAEPVLADAAPAERPARPEPTRTAALPVVAGAGAAPEATPSAVAAAAASGLVLPAPAPGPVAVTPAVAPAPAVVVPALAAADALAPEPEPSTEPERGAAEPAVTLEAGGPDEVGEPAEAGGPDDADVPAEADAPDEPGLPDEPDAPEREPAREPEDVRQDEPEEADAPAAPAARPAAVEIPPFPDVLRSEPVDGDTLGGLPAPGPVAAAGPIESPVWAPIPGVSAPAADGAVDVGPAPVGALPTGVVPAVAAAASAAAAPVPELAPLPPAPPASPVPSAASVPSAPAPSVPASGLVPPPPPGPALVAPPPGVPAEPAEAPAAERTVTPPAVTPPAESRALVPSDVVDAELATDVLDEAPSAPVDVVLALGSNLGPAQETLRQAVRDLAATTGLELVQVSPLARTAPVGGPEQPDFLNAVVLARTTLAPRELLRAVQAIEKNHRRERHERWGPRTLDIDIVVYGGVLAVTDDLELPHPRAHERAFVLQPWAEVDPHAVLPGLGGGPVAALAATAPDREGLRWMALDWFDGPKPTPAPAPTGEQPPARDA